MGRGQRDFASTQALTYTATLSDMAELAVRLGSIDIFDRRGQVIDMDDCEATVFKWFKSILGGGSAVYDGSFPKSGSQCIKFTTGTGALHNTHIEKRFVPLLSQRLGIEFSFSQPDTDTNLYMALGYLDGTNSHVGKIKVDFNAKKLSYLDSAGVYQEITDVSEFHAGTFLYYPTKVVVDFSADKFTRLLFAGTEYDLSSFLLREAASVSAPYITYSITLERRASSGGVLYADDFILTQDEP